MQDQLTETMGEVLWSDLSAHAARDAIILVADDLDLLEVGVAFAENDVQAVDAWIGEGKIAKPTAEDLVRWPLQEGMRFISLIVSPFVLVRRPATQPPS
ncbi:MAG TPA: DUF2288 domain-containing protein [Candidatus Nanopelagicales bacterium]|nr:DUF2288 domain-containing protein [Candidatus Nanopelagicales bacterium]